MPNNQPLPPDRKSGHDQSMAARRNLERATVETWAAIIIGVIAAVIPMTWQLEGFLLLIVFGLGCDLIYHAPMTGRIWAPFRLVLCIYGFVLLVMIGLPSFDERELAAENVKKLPPLLAFAGQAVRYIEHPVPLVLLAASIPIMVLWRTPLVWRFRHDLIFGWRRALAGDVWINRAAALELISHSRWATTRPTQSDSTYFGFAGLARAMNPGREVQFQRFCELTLEAFEKSNPDSFRAAGGNKEYIEAKLRAYLLAAFDMEVRKSFGTPPDIAV